MRILIYNWKDIKNPEVGGAEIILFEFAKRLIEEGHQVTWFSRSWKNALPEEDISGIQVIRKGGKLSVYFFGWWYYFRMKQKPDLVIDVLNTIFWQTPMYAKKSRVIAYVNQLAKEVFWYELHPFLAKIALLLEKYQFFSYRKTAFVTYAKSTKEDIIETGIPEKNITIFPLGLDHKRYMPGVKNSTPLFLCVSRLVKMKRTDLCILAMKKVVETHPETQLVIVGYGYERERLESLRNELGLESQVFFSDENILFFERNREDQKVEFMQKAWALLFPSVKEGWGMTVTECAACGTPAIVTDVTGLRDSVKNNETGIILQANPTPERLAEKMIDIIETENLRERLSKNAIAWSKNFDWEKSYQEFKNAIQIKSIL